MNRFFSNYLRFTSWLYRSGWLERSGVSPVRIDAFLKPAWKNENLKLTPEDRVTWFHAASVGELEILVPVIQKLVADQVKVGVSIFSESAMPALKKLPEGLVHAGFSPKESEWKDFLAAFQVEKVVVSKYEAWPALWAACSVLNLPLILINAQPRSSLRWAKRLLKAFQIPLPQLYLFTADQNAHSGLSQLFPEAKIEPVSDPRWVRVIERSKNALHHPRVEHWKNTHAQATRPYGMVGSAWLEDLQKVVPAFRKTFPESGTLWVVPHSLARENIDAMKLYLDAEIAGRFVLVDEMGFLAELYSIADWVWVGGGFGKGIHSTLEPAVYGIPVACGPKRVEEFFETHELRAHGLLTVCSSESQVSEWLKRFQGVRPISLTEKSEGFSRLVDQCRQIR
jgi:3-deoxy-D-manno-octulosonic-acid transferase